MSTSLDLPGFYYDANKKKYFRILSGSNTLSEHAITKDFVKLQNKKSERNCEKLSLLSENNIVHLLFNRTIKQNNFLTIQRQIKNNIWKNVQWIKSKEFNKLREEFLYITFNNDGYGVFVIKRFEESNQDKIFVFIVDNIFKHGLIKCLSFHQLEKFCRDIFILDDFLEDISNCKIKKIIYIKDCLYILINVEILFEVKYSKLIKLQIKSHYKICREYEYKNQLYCDKFYVNNFDQVSLLYHKKIIILDKMGKVFQKIKLKSYSCFHFCHQNNSIFLTGDKRQPIMIKDYRSTTSLFFTNNRSKLACDLKVLNGDINILTSHYNGEILLWDIRNMNIVQQFETFKNELYPIHLVINYDENYFTSMDNYGFTRIWDIFDGKIIHLMDPPINTNCKTNFKQPCIFHPITGQLFFADNESFFVSS